MMTGQSCHPIGFDEARLCSFVTPTTPPRMPPGLFLHQSPDHSDEDSSEDPQVPPSLSGRTTGLLATPAGQPNGRRARPLSGIEDGSQGPPSQRRRRERVASPARTHDPFNFEESSEPEIEERGASPMEVNTSRLSFFFTTLGVEADHQEVANELAEMGRTEQNAALVICLTAVLKRLDEMARLIGAGPARSLTGDNQLSLMSHEDQVKTHVYTAPFKIFIRHVARQAMLDEDIEAYGADHREKSLYRAVIVRHSVSSPILSPHSFLRLGHMTNTPNTPPLPQLKLNMKPGPFKEKHLPPKYLLDDPLATALVVAQVKLHLKHVRHKARNLLLSGILKASTLPYIPPIVELSRLLWRHFMDGNNTLTDTEIDKALQPRPLLRTRFVFMRMQTMHNHIRSDSANPSQWDQMDARLLELSRLPVEFTRNWQKLLCKKDKELFGASPASLDAIDKQDVYCPTNDEVKARMAELGNPS
ncbi:hypothetical protein PCANC_02758 [Puccinia coronata f. sp. avenae]|uniref:Uncharacterized protein n=1 Tax=Puccinia coronata f. sp. avenae TaxID=200324 RepID=A0A2N5VYB3_9BASI|nr:hypothetical protein PCANC_02758 [Puccinia coronata f. sp. avenae]